jgi:hypothetical protein
MSGTQAPFNPLEMIASTYELNEKPGLTREFKASGMSFSAVAHEAAGFGHVGVMNAHGMLGLMKMETVVLNPFSVDAPLFSLDRIHAFGREVLVAEMYDSLLGSSFCADPMEAAVAQCPNIPKDKDYWYDYLVIRPGLSLKGKRKDAAAFDGYSQAFLRAYLEAAAKAESCEPEEKKRKASVYSEGLLSNGGPATDPVKKAMGVEWTEDFFRTVLFGCGPA